MRKRFAALLLAVAFALTSIPGMTVYAGQNSGKTVQTQTEMGGVKTGSSSASETGAPAESKKETEASASAAQVETTPAEGNPPEESGKSETEASGQTLKAQETESVPFAASQVTENGIQVNVTADAGVFPDNTQMKVTPVSSSDVQPLIENKIEQASVTDMFAVDISFYCGGQKTEPDGNVNVSMSFPRS